MSKKDYKKSMADAMSAYEAFGEKQEAAIRHVGEEIEKTAGKVDKLGGKIGEIADYITDKEKAELYKLNTPVDIADLEDAEKRILVAVLYQLSADEDEVTEEQQNYVRAVQQYLKIYNPQTEIDLEAVENIEDISAQKAVLQAALEFFRLGTHSEELTEEQEDFLDCFQINRKTRREINSCIDAIVDAVGLRGLSEKYGFVANQPRSEFARYTDNGPIPEKVADLCIEQIRKHNLCRFINDLYFLETPKYLLFYQEKTSWNDDQLATGFYRVEKRTGNIKRMPYDAPEKAWFVNRLSFHIQNNTIYFIQQKLSYDSKSELFYLDLDNGTCEKIPFQYPSGYTVRYHLSGNDAYLMVHACVAKENSSDSFAIGSTKTCIIDLTQNNRTFILEPQLGPVQDAFIWNDKYIFAGTKLGSTPKSFDAPSTNRTSFFQYDIQNHTLEDIFPTIKSLTRSEYGVLCGGYCEVHEMRKVENAYYFLSYECKKLHTIEIGAALFRLDSDTEMGHWNYLFNPYGDRIQKIYFLDDSAICFCSRHNSLTRHIISTNENHTLHETNKGKEYFLLGDYLYKMTYSDQWFRTNVSKGWDNLQWEIMNFSD